MRTSLRLLGSAVLIVALSLPAQTTDGRGAATMDGHDLWFRSQLGYRNDVAYTDAMVVDSESPSKYGVPLTAAELRDLDRRVEVQEALDPFIAEVEEDSSAVSGLWLDQQRLAGKGVAIVVAFPGKTDDVILARLASLAPEGVPVFAERAEFSLSHLRSVLADVEARIPDLASKGLRGSHVAPRSESQPCGRVNVAGRSGDSFGSGWGRRGRTR
jgi:hypothetical protein